MPQFGLKLGIGESDLAKIAESLWRDGVFSFLELYVPADALPGQAEFWRWYDGPLVLHAPHSAGGFNFARKEMEESNFRILHNLDALIQSFSPAYTVFHPGVDGTIAETCRQVSLCRTLFPQVHAALIMENKPALGLNGEICCGASPEEMENLLAGTGCGLCLDVRHAIAYAAWAGRSWLEVIQGFIRLKPHLWHIADGRMDDLVDSHEHIGDGNVPWEAVFRLWQDDTLVTIECKKEPSLALGDFLEDRNRLISYSMRMQS